MLCTYNYYSAARPTEPVPKTCLAVANRFLKDFGKTGNACLVIEYPRGARPAQLPWHRDMSGQGGPVLTMSWGGTARFLWSPGMARGLHGEGPHHFDVTQDCHCGYSDEVYKYDVQPADVIFFDGGRVPHAVQGTEGERYNVQVRVYDAAMELAKLPLDEWRSEVLHEDVPSRYPCGSPYATWYAPEAGPGARERHAARARATYLDLLKKVVRNEAGREPERPDDADSHDMALAEAQLLELRKRFGDQKAPDVFGVYDRYVSLLRKAARQEIYGAPAPKPSAIDDLKRAEAHLGDLQQRFGEKLHLDALDVHGYFLANSPVAHSLGERAQLDNTQACVEQALADGVPGDLIETGVWQGGQTILMRGVLKAHGVCDRRVFVADSFEGLPEADPEKDLDDAIALGVLDGIGRFRVTADAVRENFARYDLLDEQVVVLEGWFCDTLPQADFGCFAVIRLDGDFFDSTRDAIEQLYPRLSPGGYVIVDDYGCPFGCRRAIDEYRAKHGVTAAICRVNRQTVYWRKPWGAAAAT